MRARAAALMLLAALAAAPAGGESAPVPQGRLPPPAAGSVRVASWSPELTRAGPGLLLRDIRSGADPQVAAAVQVIAAADPDVLLLTGFDWDWNGEALGAFAALLAQAGIYMDELAPEPGPAAVWRAFAEGLRGPQVAVLGGVSDPAALEVSAHLLRSDEIFRDAAHHFLRQFDRMMARVAPDLDDDFLAALTETRSGRAFVLLAQTSGIFGAGPADGGT